MLGTGYPVMHHILEKSSVTLPSKIQDINIAGNSVPVFRSWRREKMRVGNEMMIVIADQMNISPSI
jgi:hypothetical protein